MVDSDSLDSLDTYTVYDEPMADYLRNQRAIDEELHGFSYLIEHVPSNPIYLHIRFIFDIKEHMHLYQLNGFWKDKTLGSVKFEFAYKE